MKKIQLHRLSKNSKSLTPLHNESFRSTNSQSNKMYHRLSSKFFNVKQKKPSSPEHFESPYTLQAHTPPSISFTKEERFRNTSYQHKSENLGRLWLKNSPSFKFAIDKRKDLFICNKNPAGANYNIKTCFDNNIINKKGIILASRNSDPKDIKNVPGPGRYNVNLSWKKQNPINMTSRQFYFFYDCIKNRSTVSPQRYYINYDSTENARYRKVGFGIGDKNSNYYSITPGVGSYNLPSRFDMTRLKIPMN